MPTVLGTKQLSYDYGFGTGVINREDLLDVIVNITPRETPLFSAMPKTTTKHTYHEWLEDALDDPSSLAVGVAEGADFTAASGRRPDRMVNWTQIFSRGFNVSNTQQALDPAGMRSVYDYHMGNAMTDLARAIEYRLFASASGVTGASGTARTFKNLEQFITTNTASAASGIGATKAILDALMLKTYIAGGNPRDVYMHPATKNAFADQLSPVLTAAINQRQVPASQAAVYGNMDVYFTNFGAVRFVPDRFVPTAAATSGYGRYWLLELPKIRAAFLRPIRHIALPPIGDAVRGMIVGELTIELFAETAHAKCINLVT